MKKVSLCFGLLIAVALAAPAAAQSNDNDYTPLNSRIRRARQFPTDIPDRWRNETSAVSRARNGMMLNQLGSCLFKRSRVGSLDLLEKTDLGFRSFAQVGLDNDRALKIYGFQDCMSRVAQMNNTGVTLRFTPGALRQWLIEQAYFDRFGGGPTWVQPGYSVAAREFPLSAQDQGVQVVLDVADCVVATDPYTADFFYRAAPASSEEKRAIEVLVPSLGACIPQGQQVSLTPQALRVWFGEALWHAALHSQATPVPTAGAG